ncbi:glycosyltransferase family 2 protein [Campylobacter sp. MIT 97-5078]|nr:glycosyltransferase [Campylobacter sp. MIT 97-5078]KGI57629.1 glycosyltransferase [Campylobacter sp. MIT 97-5078]KGI57673.1 glycosyltransferase [Campylobacter sp. MIT 97-5078]TQR26613.1 glycosyltransferase family 2 protein [Campylobacter sp. MIT 97-5078]
MDTQKISVCILVKNAQDTILECLNSLSEFGEIILLDNESSDDTLKIAENFNQTYQKLHIYSNKFIGFGKLKNLALSYAKNEWILSIDSDEVLEKEALEELKALELTSNSIIALPRKNLYRGEWIKACGWYPDFVWRVFNKNFTRFNDNFVHESVLMPVNSQKIKFKNGFKHYAFKDMQGIIHKMNTYTSYSAQEKFKNGKKTSFFAAFCRFHLVFFKDYFLRSGFKYGYKGFIVALLNALGAFFRYAKLYELQKDK